MARSDIVKAYQEYLGREPDDAGLAYWTGNLSSGAESLESILFNIQNSKEAKAYIPPPDPTPPNNPSSKPNPALTNKSV